MDDGYTEHSGCPVVKGEKWITTAWMREGVTAEKTWEIYDPSGVEIFYSDIMQSQQEKDQEEDKEDDNAHNSLADYEEGEYDDLSEYLKIEEEEPFDPDDVDQYDDYDPDL